MDDTAELIRRRQRRERGRRARLSLLIKLLVVAALGVAAYYAGSGALERLRLAEQQQKELKSRQ